MLPPRLTRFAPLQEHRKARLIGGQIACRRLCSPVKRQAGDGGTVFSLRMARRRQSLRTTPFRISITVNVQIFGSFGRSRHFAPRSCFLSATAKASGCAQNSGSRQNQAKNRQDRESAHNPSLRSIGVAEMPFWPFAGFKGYPLREKKVQARKLGHNPCTKRGTPYEHFF